MPKIVAGNSNVPIKMFLFSYRNTPHTQSVEASEFLLNLLNTRLSLLKLNRSIVNDEEKFAKSEIL